MNENNANYNLFLKNSLCKYKNLIVIWLFSPTAKGMNLIYIFSVSPLFIKTFYVNVLSNERLL